MSPKPRIIFVCVENSNRSQMAEALARLYGGDRVEAFRSGSQPSGRINPKAVEAMREVGYDLTTHTSKGLDGFNGQQFAAAVTMGCGDDCPLVHADRRVDWQIPDPRDMAPDEFRRVRDLIAQKVRELLADLGVPGPAGDVVSAVREKYGQVAGAGLSSDRAGVRAVAEAFGSSAAALGSTPAEANMGLSCGNPTATANLRPGEVVVDLGCGGGLDVLLAAKKVGPEGRAIGIDMTPDMLALARRNAAKAGAANAEFHQATIDRLPLPDASVDCVITNCVINPAPDKAAVFREVARVLKPGGWLAVSDIALIKPLPPGVGDDLMAYIGCIAGAIPVEDYRAGLTAAGFAAVELVPTGTPMPRWTASRGVAPRAWGRRRRWAGCRCDRRVLHPGPGDGRHAPRAAGRPPAAVRRERLRRQRPGVRRQSGLTSG